MDKARKAYLEAVERIEAAVAASITVKADVSGFMVEQPTGEDTFMWIVGPELKEWFKEHDAEKSWIASGTRPSEMEFHFPKNRADLAMLFKLTFG